MTGCTLVRRPSLLDPVAEPGTLDDRMVALWEGLTADLTVDCPVCGGKMRPEYGVHSRAIGGRCAACGSSVR